MKRFFVVFIFVLFCKNSYHEKYVEGLIGDIVFRSAARSLAVPMVTSHGKCKKEVPSILLRKEFNENVRGNGSTIYFSIVETCCDGFKQYPYDSNRCVPDCKDNCRNGICLEPNVCKCMDGFVANASNHCIETCPIGCPNGRCYLNGTSQCNRGYELDPTQRYCSAICRNACGKNQVCIRPNECACLDGYSMTESGCQPVCSPDCGYGTCIAPNNCQCLEIGAVMKQKTCHRFSELRCENGIVESQYKCKCRIGFKYDSNTTTCLPDCGDDCKYGVCEAPGKCRCFNQYEQKDTTCVPICANGCGFYGKCIEPNVCGCGEDNQKCVNGVCNSRGKCVCNKDLFRYVDACVSYNNLTRIVTNSYEKKRYNIELLNEFNNHIGKYFMFAN